MANDRGDERQYLDRRWLACCTALIAGSDGNSAVAGSARRGRPEWPIGLPAPLTAFIGRASEIAEVARLVGMHRLVTLVGAGGVGKTRAAIEVASGLQSFFADGVDLVDLSAVSVQGLLP